MSGRKKKLQNTGKGSKRKIARKQMVQIESDGTNHFPTLTRNLPAFVKLLSYLSINTKKKLRRVCKDLYRLVTDLDQCFQMWCITADGYRTIPSFVLKSNKPVFLTFDDCPFSEFKDPDFYEFRKVWEVEEKVQSICDLSKVSVMIGRVHDRVIGLSVYEGALRKLKYFTADMTELQIIKIDGNGADESDEDNYEDYEDEDYDNDSDEEYDDDKATKRFKALLPLITRNAATLQRLEIKDLELPEDCKITCQLPSLKEATFLNCIGQSFIESVIDNAPALKKKVIEN